MSLLILFYVIICGPEGTRTPDLLTASQAF